ncbi:MAG: kinase [Fusicatenibacter sp.]|nr:kinase [Lachnospiraceae bacterium]MDY2936738.1 kinase [Fusicatenibacter sp.]
MHMTEIQKQLNAKGISYTYTEEDNLGSIDFVHRGLSYHIWEYADADEPVGVETNLRFAGRSEELEGNYDSLLAAHIEQYF